MNIEAMLTDDDFLTGFEGEVIPKGKYIIKCIKGNPRVRTSKAGNRYLNIRLAAVANADGETVNSEIIYHTVPFEGTDKNGNPLRRMFAGFFSALGLEKDAVREIYAGLLEAAPIAGETEEKGTEVQLTLGGDHFTLDGRTLMASIKVEEFEGTERNVVSSVWAIKE